MLAAAILVPLIIRWVSAADAEPPSDEAGRRVMRFSKGYKLAILVCAVLFGGMAVLANAFPGKTPPHQMPWILAVFAGMSIMSVFGLFMMNRSPVSWDDNCLSGANLFGKRCTVQWSDISNVKYVDWAQGFKIATASGDVIWAYPTMQGFGNFVVRLNFELRRLDLPEIALEP